MEFDLDLAVAENSQNPVYYCQYAHARICSILRKLKEQGCGIPEGTPEQLDLLTAPEAVSYTHLDVYKRQEWI